MEAPSSLINRWSRVGGDRVAEKYIAADKPLYLAFVDLEKAFDRVHRNVLWWALRSLNVFWCGGVWKCLGNGVARTLKKLRTSEGDN